MVAARKRRQAGIGRRMTIEIEKDIPLDTESKVVAIRPGVALRGQAKNENGLTAKQEAFAGYVAEGNTLIASYKLAFKPPTASDKTLHSKAWDLMRRDAIKARVNALVAQKNEVKQLDAAKMLSFIRERLLIEAQDQSNKPSDRLKAIELIGKLSDVAAFRDRIVTEDNTTKSAIEMEQEIKRKLEKILAA